MNLFPFDVKSEDITDAAMIQMIVVMTKDGKGRVAIAPFKVKAPAFQPNMNSPEPASFGTMMCACEYLMNAVAQESKAGYEKALDLLREGAMTYKTIQKGMSKER